MKRAVPTLVSLLLCATAASRADSPLVEGLCDDPRSYHCTRDYRTVYSDSPEALRDRYLAAIAQQDWRVAWRMFCMAATSDRIVALYRQIVDETLTVPLTSVTLEGLDPSEKPIPYSVTPLGRLIFEFDESRQEGPTTVVSSVLYYGRKEQGYCLGIPQARPM